jgi:hypothetical protein
MAGTQKQLRPNGGRVRKLIYRLRITARTRADRPQPRLRGQRNQRRRGPHRQLRPVLSLRSTPALGIGRRFALATEGLNRNLKRPAVFAISGCSFSKTRQNLPAAYVSSSPKSSGRCGSSARAEDRQSARNIGDRASIAFCGYAHHSVQKLPGRHSESLACLLPSPALHLGAGSSLRVRACFTALNNCSMVTG